MTMDASKLGIQAGPLPEGRCLAGFSGGADSTAMMFLLAEARDAGRIMPEAIHVNHGLRGEESDGDEAFCRDICERLQIPLHIVRLDLEGRTDENACREERFRSFRDTLAQTGIRSLLLAHNRDDVAETFMMRLMRGAGTEGLACMGACDEHESFTIYRPLSGTGREEIRTALRRAGIAWREDSSNSSGVYFRNLVRSRLIPVMEEMSPGAAARIAQTVSILAGENEQLDREARAFLQEHSYRRWLDADALAALNEPIRKRILRTWWRMTAPLPEEHALNARQTAELASLAGSSRGKVNLPGGTYAVRCRNGIYLGGWPREQTGETPYTAGKIRFGETVLATLPPEGNPGDGRTAQEVPESFLRGCVIRTRKPGDRISPFGMQGSRKLQDYFTDRGIDEPWRDEIPLLCRGNEVLLAAGVGAGAIPGWQPDAGNVRLAWQGRLPWMAKEWKRT